MKIKEIFTSIQGEGSYIGYKQLFIRLCGCNLNCKYCDTDYKISNSKDYSVDELISICNNNLDCHSLALTGGEPLLNIEFLKYFIPKSPLPVYLETNGTLCKELLEIIDFIQYIAADIKLPSCTGGSPLWDEHKEFFTIASQKNLFAKAVFDNNINDFEIHKMCNLCKEFDIELILQPMMKDNALSVNSDFIITTLNKCLKIYPNVRVIPQVHKFINVL